MPELDALRIGFIGAGRVGQGLAKALSDAGCRVTAAASRSRESSERLAALAKGCRALDTTQAVVDSCDLVFVTTPDAAIEPAARALTWQQGQAAVHCSGATEVAALDTPRSAGALTGGFHPIQSFTDPKAAAASLPGSTITIEAEPPLDRTLTDLAAALGCRVNRLPPGQRALYHASCGYGSQFLNVLLEEIAAVWRGWGAQDADVIAAILPMMRGTLDSIESAGIAAGMPGPVSRGDAETVEKHVAAMGDIGGDALAFYIAHCFRSIALAQKAGRIDRNTAQHIADVLSG